jgi:hypothetical protein
VNIAGETNSSYTISSVAIADSGSQYSVVVSNTCGSPTSNNATLTVNKADTSTGVTSDINPSTFGQSVTFTATVTVSSPGAGSPSGTVQFKHDGSDLGSPASLGASGTASINVDNLVVNTAAHASHSITAVYSGNTSFNTSTSSALSQVVNKADQAALVLSVPASITYGSTGLASTTGGTGAGDVSFSDGLSTGCAVNASSGVISVSNASGTCAISASKAGDNNHNGPVSDGPKTVALNKKALTVTAPTLTITLGQSVPTLAPIYAAGDFVGSDGPSDLDTAPTCATTTAVTGVGTYTTRCSSGSDNNYTFSYTAGTLKVIYRFDGFLQPINDTAHQIGLYESKFKLGSTIPVKFQLKTVGGAAQQTTTLLSFSSKLIGTKCDNLTDTETAVATDAVTSGTAFRWDSTLQGYIYNYSTKSLTAGEYRIYASLDDGTVQTVDICMTK